MIDGFETGFCGIECFWVICFLGISVFLSFFLSFHGALSLAFLNERRGHPLVDLVERCTVISFRPEHLRVWGSMSLSRNEGLESLTFRPGHGTAQCRGLLLLCTFKGWNHVGYFSLPE